MGIESIPPSYDTFEAYSRAYEATHFTDQETNRRVANATRKMLLSWFPQGLQPVANSAIPALLDPPLLQSLGWKPAPKLLTDLLTNVLQLRSRSLRQLPPRTLPEFFVDQSIRSYPRGYEVNDIGPSSLLNALNMEQLQ